MIPDLPNFRALLRGSHQWSSEGSDTPEDERPSVHSIT